MSHNLDLPIVREYHGHELFLKFDWEKPNDLAPIAARVLVNCDVPGLASTVGELHGPWANYLDAVAEAIAVGERWVDSQLAEKTIAADLERSQEQATGFLPLRRG